MVSGRVELGWAGVWVGGRERYGIIWYELKVTGLVRVGGK